MSQGHGLGPDSSNLAAFVDEELSVSLQAVKMGIPRRRSAWEEEGIQSDPRSLSMLSVELAKGAEMVNGKMK